MEFHHDGEMFAFYFKDSQVMKITYVDQIEELVEQLRSLESPEEQDEYHVNYDGRRHGQDLSFIEHIKFDTGKKFIIGWGGTKIFLLNLVVDDYYIDDR
jgi:hypothetical protein